MTAGAVDAPAPSGTRPRALRVNVDGGARGNPGPAAVGVVVRDAEGEVILEVAEAIGESSNNVAEYRALLRGVEAALKLGADEVTFINDSELVARQLTGAYKVKHPEMQRLHAEAITELGRLRHWSIASVPRAENAEADALVNAALDRTG